MLGNLARKIFGSPSDRVTKQLTKQVAQINALESQQAALSDEGLQKQTEAFKARVAAGEKLDALLPEAFAAVREAARRTLGQRHFDVQLMGGMVLHQGKIAEMKTGEGKTLVATLPVYLNALTGKGVHVVTVNDYLAQRDSAWMGQVYRFLGLSVGVIVQGLNDDERRAAYAADVTYGTNNEFGFDYLRDNMKFRLSDMVQRPFHFAIVDEVDSILIDEARTPLIISGPAEDSSELYRRVDAIVRELTPADYEKDEKFRSVTLTDAGNERAEQLLQAAGILDAGGLYGAENVSIVHHVHQALRAHTLFARDVDYVVKSDKVIIIDEFTGRMMEGRRYSDGLHQALEAKERVSIQRENQTLASITFQNYFRMYPKLGGMTGTAQTEAAEFAEIYGLDVVEMPTHVPVQRLDMDDEVYRTPEEKYAAIVALIETCRLRQQPVLVGTVSIEKSELLSEYLKKKNIAHHLLNARYHEQEASIVAQAGRAGAVTIATNMAGRGTDIQLGGKVDMRIKIELEGVTDEAERALRTAQIKAEVASAKEQVLAAGGLFVIGTERHESRRIDNQLRGRSGRQGDPGASKFFLSLQDDLLRIYGAEKMDPLLVKLGIQEGEAIAHPWINSGLKRAQEKVEARNFDVRKNLLKYDNVMNDQRKVIYEQRREIMAAESVAETVADMRDGVIERIVAAAIPAGSYAEQWDVAGLDAKLREQFGMELPLAAWAKEDGIAESEFEQRIREAALARLQDKETQLGVEPLRGLEKSLLLATLDQNWKQHLLALDHLRQGIHLRGYAQRDPLHEFGREAFALFQTMLELIREEVVSTLLKTQLRLPTMEELLAQQAARLREMRELSAEEAAAFEALPPAGAEMLPEGMQRREPPISRVMPQGATPVVLPDFDASNPATWVRTPRNAPCPCGSGKKYKHCHGVATG